MGRAMKKLSMVFAAMMLLGTIPPMTAEAIQAESNWFYDDFEDKTDWQSLADYGWTSANGGPVTIKTEGENKYLNIATPWGTTLVKEFSQPLTGLVGMEMDMAVSFPSISHFGFVDAMGATQNLLYFSPENGAYQLIFAPTWEELPFTLSEGEWVKIELIINAAHNACTMWVTTQGQERQVVFFDYNLNSLSGGIGGITFNYPAWYQISDGSDFKLDNVRVYRVYADYQLNGAIEAGGQTIASPEELYARKGDAVQVKINASRTADDGILTGNVYYGLYQREQLIDIQAASVTFGKKDYHKELVFDMNLSRVTSADLTVKFFLWKPGNYSPVATTQNVFKEAIRIFVSKSQGLDSNNGNAEFPVQSINKAKEIARGYKENKVDIFIHQGDYAENVSFDDRDKRHPAYPLTIQSVDNATVRLIGAVPLAGTSFTSVADSEVLSKIPAAVRGDVRQIDLGSQGITAYGEIVPIHYGESSAAPSELFINETALRLSRWPNDTYAKVDTVLEQTANSFTFTGVNAYDRVKSWSSAKDAWVYGFWYWDWLNEGIKVKSVNPQTGAITTVRNTQVRPGQRFYIYNLLEELDSPGEFYLDRDTGILYVYPINDFIPTDDVLLSLNTEPLLRFSNTANIHIKGVEMGYTRGSAVAAENCSAISIKDCTVQFTGQVGIQAANTTNLTVSGCTITETGAGGVLSSGGDVASLTSSNNVFTNNHVYRYSRLIQSYTPAFRIAGVGMTVSHNLIHDAEHTAIMYSGNDHVVEYNEIYNVCTSTDDSGAIYTGQSWNDRGNIVRYNYLHDITGPAGGYGVNGVYLDDIHSSTHVYGNIFYMVSRPVLVGGGRDNIIENNLMLEATVNSTGSVVIDQRGVEEWFAHNVNEQTGICYLNLKNVPYLSDLWRNKYPELYTILANSPREPRGNVVKNNVIYRHKSMGISPLVVAYGEISNNFITDLEDIGFEDYENGNFKLKQDAVVFNHIPEFKQIPIDEIGLKNQ